MDSPTDKNPPDSGRRINPADSGLRTTSIWIVLRIRILRTPDPGPFFDGAKNIAKNKAQRIPRSGIDIPERWKEKPDYRPDRLVRLVS